MGKEIKLTIGELNAIYEKYGDLGIKVETQYGFKDITWCGITEKNAEVYRCELENGLYVEGADYHKVKNNKGEFIHLKEIELGELIQTRDGFSPVKESGIMDIKDTLYDIQVDEVHEYYSNDIVSHNTSFAINSLDFLFFGTTSKTDKNEDIFNTYSDSNEVVVKGCIDIDGVEYIIERKLTRKPKRSGEGFTVRGTVAYYELLPDGTERDLDGEDGIKTTQIIKETVGSHEDFEMVVMATADNLTNLIDSKPTARGKLLTKFIGLDPIEKKEEVVRKLYNTFAKTMKANSYDITTLTSEIEELKVENDVIKNNNVKLETELGKQKIELSNHNTTRDGLIESKQEIDDEVLSVNESSLKIEIDNLIKDGVTSKSNIKIFTDEITEIGDVSFDEEKDFTLTKEKNEYLIKKGSLEDTISKLETTNEGLKNSETCSLCGAPLKDVDHSKIIKANEVLIKTHKAEVANIVTTLESHQIKLDDMKTAKDLVNKKEKLELKKDRLEIEIDKIRNKVISKRNLLKEYKLNLGIIESNKSIESKIVWENNEIAIISSKIKEIEKDIINNDNEVKANIKTISTKDEIILEIEREDKIERVYKIYIDMIGKRGITKLVLRSVLPIINSELQRLLDDTTNFDIVLDINDKNDVEFNIVLDDITKPIKSSSGFEETTAAIALRAILGRMTSLSTPNFIVFDEIFGKIANNNLDKVELLFSKIKDMYDVIFLITHNEIVKEWGDNNLTVIKEKNISKLKQS